jgi:hypothetical protein
MKGLLLLKKRANSNIDPDAVIIHGEPKRSNAVEKVG